MEKGGYCGLIIFKEGIMKVIILSLAGVDLSVFHLHVEFYDLGNP